jgi:thymidylate synthase ThyX
MIQAKIIADSINSQGDRLTTFIVTFLRIILAEFNTHRMFSRNSASSRAIPFDKMVKSVQKNPFIPIAWQKDHKGMQGNEYETNEQHINEIKKRWLIAKDEAIELASQLNYNYEITKQICNRLLEPFMWHTVIITSGKEGLENFFNLRCPNYDGFKSKKEFLKENPELVKVANLENKYWLTLNKGQSEIHIMALAELMYDAYNESKPKQLQADEWHIPFSDNVNYQDKSFDIFINGERFFDENLIIKVSTAKCARVSYTVVGEESKEPNYENDIKLHDRLAESSHWSPFEHCAKAMSDEEYQSYRKGKHEVTLMDNTENKYWFIEDESGELGWCNNFKGFIQYRYLIENGHS